jgi:hypothetical protein
MGKNILVIIIITITINQGLVTSSSFVLTGKARPAMCLHPG